MLTAFDNTAFFIDKKGDLLATNNILTVIKRGAAGQYDLTLTGIIVHLPADCLLALQFYDHLFTGGNDLLKALVGFGENYFQGIGLKRGFGLAGNDITGKGREPFFLIKIEFVGGYIDRIFTFTKKNRLL